MQSNGMAWNPPMRHPLEKAMRDAGEVMFHRRADTVGPSVTGYGKLRGNSPDS